MQQFAWKWICVTQIHNIISKNKYIVLMVVLQLASLKL